MSSAVPDHNELPAVSQRMLDEAIEKHAKYLRGQGGGARAVLQYRNLSGLDFKQADLSQADFTGSFFIEADLSKGTFKSACFFACDMRNAKLNDANLRRADFRGAYVAGANLSGADMSDVDLREGKIMTRGEDGLLVDRKRSAGAGAKTVLSGRENERDEYERRECKLGGFFRFRYERCDFNRRAS